MASRLLRSVLRAFGLFAVLVGATTVHAASIEVTEQGPSKPSVIVLRGRMEFGDEKKFADEALSHTDAIVSFESDGGSVLAGIEIGKAIRLKGFQTRVP